MTRNVRVRIPPSPTGYCHVGTARMAILNFLFARKHGGTIIFRSEDTDKERSRTEYEEDIIEQLQWLGLSWDDFHRTTELVEDHKDAIKKLISENKAYVSEEESKKEPGKTVHIVRLKNPGKSITFTDLIRGDITFDTSELGDFAIARAIDDPLYHLAVVVDDVEMDITHIIRGEDHISNTPRQILIQEALGYERPEYAHYPLHLGSDKSKLSKRTGDVSVKSYREKGYLPEALLNYIAHLGWTPPSGREIMSLKEMINEFDIGGLHKSGAVFDIEKLRWFNRNYLLTMPREEFSSATLAVMERAIRARELEWNDNTGSLLLEMIRERISVWDDIDILINNGELDYFFSEPEYDTTKLPGKNSASQSAIKHLGALHKILASVPDALFSDPEQIKKEIWDYAMRNGTGTVLWPFRYALTGLERSPDPFFVASVIGKPRILKRVAAAVGVLTSV